MNINHSWINFSTGMGSFNIKEVKNLVGFENADYFRKCFKEVYNVTPSEYTEKHKK